MNNKIIISEFDSFIFNIRGFNVMLDSDLAALYETETKKLKQQVRRNIDRFPNDFMFELTEDEKIQLQEQVSRLSMLKHTYASLMAFSEQGVAMLSSILHTKKAVQVNIEIMRAFVNYRARLLDNKELRKDIKQLDEKINSSFRYLLKKIDALSPKLKQKTHKKVGFKRNNEN